MLDHPEHGPQVTPLLIRLLNRSAHHPVKDEAFKAAVAQAQDKLVKFTTKIGYPDEWKDYSGLTVDPADLVGNVSRSRQLEHNRELENLGGPINRAEWFMTPHTVNAYYNPPMNEIVFPAAILQPWRIPPHAWRLTGRTLSTSTSAVR